MTLNKRESFRIKGIRILMILHLLMLPIQSERSKNLRNLAILEQTTAFIERGSIERETFKQLYNGFNNVIKSLSNVEGSEKQGNGSPESTVQYSAAISPVRTNWLNVLKSSFQNIFWLLAGSSISSSPLGRSLLHLVGFPASISGNSVGHPTQSLQTGTTSLLPTSSGLITFASGYATGYFSRNSVDSYHYSKNFSPLSKSLDECNTEKEALAVQKANEIRNLQSKARIIEDRASVICDKEAKESLARYNERLTASKVTITDCQSEVTNVQDELDNEKKQNKELVSNLTKCNNQRDIAEKGNKFHHQLQEDSGTYVGSVKHKCPYGIEAESKHFDDFANAWLSCKTWFSSHLTQWYSGAAGIVITEILLYKMYTYYNFYKTAPITQAVQQPIPITQGINPLSIITFEQLQSYLQQGNVQQPSELAPNVNQLSTVDPDRDSKMRNMIFSAAMMFQNNANAARNAGTFFTNPGVSDSPRSRGDGSSREAGSHRNIRMDSSRHEAGNRMIESPRQGTESQESTPRSSRSSISRSSSTRSRIRTQIEITPTQYKGLLKGGYRPHESDDFVYRVVQELQEQNKGRIQDLSGQSSQAAGSDQ